MLSRAAERIYWVGRYLERAEDSARIVQQFAHLLLDLPDEVGMRWHELVRVVGAAPAFAASGSAGDGEAVLEFLIANGETPVSLLSCLRMARENMRNTRDLVPQESWESINECYRFARDALAAAVTGENRFDILAECISRCQQINGSLTGTMSHGNPYHFLMLGQCIERADMTSRVIDVAVTTIRQDERLVQRYGSTLWTNVLKSVSGFQMYRQYCQPQVTGAAAAAFLIGDARFPRAIRFCLDCAAASAEALPQGEDVATALHALTGLPGERELKDLGANEVSQLMDRLQIGLGGVHADIVERWFLPEMD